MKEIDLGGKSGADDVMPIWGSAAKKEISDVGASGSAGDEAVGDRKGVEEIAADA